jgi:8-oxo-dGTP pyrophosphatase MutT (NUDIX family)
MDAAPRIQLVGRRCVCRNARFDVFLDEIVDGLQRRVPDYLSVVPVRSNSDGVTGVAILPVVAGRFGLMRVFRHPQGATGWEIPKGFIETDETVAAAAARELREESGLGATAECLVDLGHVAPAPGVIKARIKLFAAIDPTPVAAAADDDLAHGPLEFFTAEEAFGMAHDSAIQDPCTLVAIYRFRQSTRPMSTTVGR